MPYKIDACDESWDAMTPEGAGRHCAHCQKTVIDGTGMTEKEFAELVKGSKETPCVRLNWKPGAGPVFRKKPRRRGPALVLLTAVAACAGPEPEQTLGIPLMVEEPQEEEESDPALGGVVEVLPTEAELPCEAEDSPTPGESISMQGNVVQAEGSEPCGSEDHAGTETPPSQAGATEENSDTAPAVRPRMGRVVPRALEGRDPLRDFLEGGADEGASEQ